MEHTDNESGTCLPPFNLQQSRRSNKCLRVLLTNPTFPLRDAMADHSIHTCPSSPHQQPWWPKIVVPHNRPTWRPILFCPTSHDAISSHSPLRPSLLSRCPLRRMMNVANPHTPSHFCAPGNAQKLCVPRSSRQESERASTGKWIRKTTSNVEHFFEFFVENSSSKINFHFKFWSTHHLS